MVDVWDALTSDRPYRRAWSRERAAEHLRSLAGSHFDPRVVEVFFACGIVERSDASASPVAAPV